MKYIASYMTKWLVVNTGGAPKIFVNNLEGKMIAWIRTINDSPKSYFYIIPFVEFSKEFWYIEAAKKQCWEALLNLGYLYDPLLENML